jgi:phage terminase large subunit-like protein
MSASAEFPHVAQAEAYARAVVAGKIPNCQWVKLACARHLNDLKRAKTDKRFRYYFDPKAAERVCRFISTQVLTKGRWAAKGERFLLQPWQCFLTCVLFGWLRLVDNKRRFRRTFFLIPRKNGKSEWAAAVGLYMLTADGEFGAEVYAGATSEKQAWFVFGAARQMALRNPKLQSAFSLTVNASNLHVLGRNAKFEPIIGNPGDGGNASCAIIDEYHEHDTDAQHDTMLTGMGAREHPLMLVITTAGDNVAGPCFQAQLEAQKVLSGVLENEELFAVIYGIDPTDDWTSDEALIKANPNLGVSVFLEFLQQQRNTALTQPRKAGTFKTKHLNVWVQAREAYFPVQRWLESEDRDLRLADFRGQVCYLGLDLASKIDLASLVAIFPYGTVEIATSGGIVVKTRFAVFARSYLPEETVEEPAAELYQGWRAQMGHNGGPAFETWERDEDGFEQPQGEPTFPAAPILTVTDGAQIDFDVIERDVAAFSKAFQVACVCYDPHQATYFITRLMARGVPVLEFKQTVLNYSEPMKETEAFMRERRIAHDGDPCLSWMISNVVAKVDAKDNVYPRKEAPENKIDGAIALISAVAAMKLAPESTESVYEKRGLIEIDLQGV